jgi:hypothetical protein
VGSYDIVPSAALGTGLSNYDITYANGTLTVNPVGALPTLTITASSDSMVYGGTVPTITPSYSGFVTGDSASSLTTPPTCSTTATSLSLAGSANTSSCTGAVDPSYTIVYAPGTVTVKVKPLTITANGQSKTFGDALALGTTAFTASGLVSPDAVSGVTLTSAGADAGAAVGSYDIVPSAALGTGLSNYDITYANGTLTVAAAPATPTPTPTTPTPTPTTPTPTPTTPTPTPTTPTPTPTTAVPTQMVGGETGTPYQSIEGATSAPHGNPTPPATNAPSNSSGSNGTPFFVLFVCFAFGSLAMLIVEKQRRRIRR